MILKTTVKLQYKNIYFFRYKAKGEGKLHVYDQAPLVIFLDIRRNDALGINIHWIPRNKRQQFIDLVLELSEKVIQKKIVRYLPRLYYLQVKNNPILSENKFSRIITQILVVILYVKPIIKPQSLTHHMIKTH